MSRPIINGLATYGIIRLYNTGSPVLAFLLTLLFAGGPVVFLFAIALAITVFKPLFLAVGTIYSLIFVSGTVGMALENDAMGWFVGTLVTSSFWIGYLLYVFR